MGGIEKRGEGGTPVWGLRSERNSTKTINITGNSYFK